MDLHELTRREQLALAVNRPTARREPLAGRELEVVAAVERVHRLHETLAERVAAENERAIVILERAGDDLGSRRRAAVDEHGQRDLFVEMLAVRAGHLRGLIARTDADDLLTGLQEEAGRLERLI